MAESTLSLEYDDFMAEVGGFLGYGVTSGNWSAAQAAEILRYVQAGVRQFYYPPAVDGTQDAYEWSFLKPTTTITTIAAYSTGTLEVSSGICTLTGGTFPSWALTDGTLVIDGTTYTISSRDDDTQLTVVGDDVAAGESDWSLNHSGYQVLPDDLSRVITDFFFPSETYSRSVVQVSEARILQLLQQTDDSDRPRYFAVRYKDSDQLDGQRLEVVWWPVPDDAYVMTYQYEAYSGTLSSVRTHPLGGMKYSELVLESCLSVAELRANDEKGIHWEAFVGLLKAGIALDRKVGARFYGHMGGPGEDVVSRHSIAGSSYDLTYKGVTW